MKVFMDGKKQQALLKDIEATKEPKGRYESVHKDKLEVWVTTFSPQRPVHSFIKEFVKEIWIEKSHATRVLSNFSWYLGGNSARHGAIGQRTLAWQRFWTARWIMQGTTRDDRGARVSQASMHLGEYRYSWRLLHLQSRGAGKRSRLLS